MFKVCTALVVSRYVSVAVRHKLNISRSFVYNRLKSEHHSSFQLHPLSAFTVICDMRIFVLLIPYPMPSEFLHNYKTMILYIFFDSITNITDSISSARCINTCNKSTFCCQYKLFCGVIYFPHWHCKRRICKKTLMFDASVNTDNIALFKDAVTTDPMHNFIVHRNTKRSRVCSTGAFWLIIQKSWLISSVAHSLLCKLVKFACGLTRLDSITHHTQ